MDLGMAGRTAVITGSTPGIGLAIATALAAEGASVVVNGRTPPRVAAAIGQIRRTVKDGLVRGVAADLGTAAGVEDFTRAVPDADVLVNNLGIFEAKPFMEIPDADWLRLFEVNVVFISSESAQQIPAEMIHYGMTKTAQVAVARGLA